MELNTLTLTSQSSIFRSALGFSVGALVLLWIFVHLVGYGTANAVDQFSFWLHTWAVRHRQRQVRTAAEISKNWVMQLEKDGEPDGEPEPKLIIASRIRRGDDSFGHFVERESPVTAQYE